MKKIMLITAGLMLLGNALVMAEKMDSAEADIYRKDEKMVTLNTDSSRVNQLERRMDTLERELRSQNDSIRDLERDLSDLRRRR